MCECCCFNAKIGVSASELAYFRELQRLARTTQDTRIKLLVDGFFTRKVPITAIEAYVDLFLKEEAEQQYNTLRQAHFFETAEKSFKETAKRARLEPSTYESIMAIFAPTEEEKRLNSWSVEQTEYYKVLTSKQAYGGDFYSLFSDFKTEELQQWLSEGAQAGLTAEQMIQQAQKEGFSGKKFVNSVDYRLQNIARTETSVAQNQGAAIEILASDVEFVQYSAVDSSVLCSFCEERNGMIFSKNSPYFWEMVPPMHYNCRCRVAPVTKRVLKRLKITDERIRANENRIARLDSFDWGGGSIKAGPV